jgi:beta-glucosidase
MTPTRFLPPTSTAGLQCLLLLVPAVATAASPSWLTARDPEIRSLVDKMTLEEKVGQMTQPDLGAIKDFNDVKSLCLGSVLSGGGSDPKNGNTLEDWSNIYQNCQSRALETRLAIPLLYGIDAVHGHNNVLGAVVFPHNIGLGCSRNPKLVEEISRITALEVRATGIQWTFAPCVTVPRDIRWGRTYEGYSEDPALVAVLGAAAVRGLQGTDLSERSAVVGCAKHFIGDGGTTYGTASQDGWLDQGDTRMDEPTLRAVHMAGYPAAIDAGVATIMPSYSSWNGVKCSGNKYLLTDVLKKELGFEGFLVSDYNAIDQIVGPAGKSTALAGDNAAGQITTADYKKCIEISINAGMDMVMVTGRYREFITLLQELVMEDKVPMSRIDDAVTRILRVKFAGGLIDRKAKLMPDGDLQRKFGSKEHRAIARKAVAETIVLLKNNRHLLPLGTSTRHIHVAGRGADDLGMQCGGWTIDWQGKAGEITPGGTTILAAIKQSVSPKSKVTFSADGSGAAGADVGIVVVGEQPYAEMKGDRADLSLAREDAAAFSKLKAAGIPVVVVVLSGRPLILGEVAEQADALVAAWLPGSEGRGVTDVLFGAVPFKGRLSFSWPRSMDQIPFARMKNGDALFPFGFGLMPQSTKHANDL